MKTEGDRLREMYETSAGSFSVSLLRSLFSGSTITSTTLDEGKLDEISRMIPTAARYFIESSSISGYSDRKEWLTSLSKSCHDTHLLDFALSALEDLTRGDLISTARQNLDDILLVDPSLSFISQTVRSSIEGDRELT